ncbi:MAG: hypothetical protein ACK4UJ_04245 [Leptonema sp. (in: bacteria)]
MSIMDLFLTLVLSIFIASFCNFLIQNRVWKKRMDTIKNKNLALFSLMAKIGACVKCLSFWMSLVIYSFYFLFLFREDPYGKLPLIIVSSIFTSFLAKLLFYLNQRNKSDKVL